MAKTIFTKNDLDKIRHLYESDVSATSIAKQFGVCRSVITRVLKEMGIFRNRKLSVDDHKKRLAEHKKVELIGKWVDSQTKTLYRCLKHKEIHHAYPGNVMKGHGLKCCTQEGQERYRSQQVNESSSTYDEKIKEVAGGKIIRIDQYINTKIPITHWCHTHKERHKARPGNVLSGFGLKCCRDAWSREQAVIRNDNARYSYDEKLLDRSDGRFTRLEDYIDATTSILHRCKIHGEDHLAVPNALLNGVGMKCCNTGAGWDTLQNILEGKSLLTGIEDPCQFYIFQVSNTDDCVKIGIAKNSLRRSRHYLSKDLYGDVVDVWQCSTRRNAILIETAILRDPTLEYPSDVMNGLVCDHGKTEVRRVNIEFIESYVQGLFDSLEDEGNHWSSWALENIPMLRTWEITQLKKLV